MVLKTASLQCLEPFRRARLLGEGGVVQKAPIPLGDGSWDGEQVIFAADLSAVYTVPLHSSVSAASHQLLKQKKTKCSILHRVTAPGDEMGKKWGRKSAGKGWFAPSSCWLFAVEVI